MSYPVTSSPFFCHQPCVFKLKFATAFSLSFGFPPPNFLSFALPHYESTAVIHVCLFWEIAYKQNNSSSRYYRITSIPIFEINMLSISIFHCFSGAFCIFPWICKVDVLANVKNLQGTHSESFATSSFASSIALWIILFTAAAVPHRQHAVQWHAGGPDPGACRCLPATRHQSRADPATRDSKLENFLIRNIF